MNIIITCILYNTNNGILYNIAWFKYWKKSVCICINWQCSRFIFHFSFDNAPLCSKLACKIHALFAFLMTPLLLIFFMLHYFSYKSKYLSLLSFKTNILHNNWSFIFRCWQKVSTYNISLKKCIHRAIKIRTCWF